ncbi:DUF3613 domain-containing protein [Dyella japonica]|uniref:DUF3613 domain-containing protein n=1 Tax=Dyella japonica TaxID=231455 RepID=UPI0009DAEDC2|nr:DUF3613 domain-containing protein [Dyella japonica]
MKPSMTSCQRLAIAALLGGAMSLAAHAQQTPITGQMGAPGASTGTAHVPAPSPFAGPLQPTPGTDTGGTATHVGSVTRQLFAMQSQGTNAGRALPIPGQEASASYQRYLKSFSHSIPEFYDTAVSKNGSSAGGTGGSSGVP